MMALKHTHPGKSLRKHTQGHLKLKG